MNVLYYYSYSMIKKGFRLKGKDINYLVKKRNYFTYEIFGVYYVPQYPNRQYNQFSVNIGLWVSKSAVMRHFIKRIVMRYVSEQKLQEKKFGSWYYKCFVMVHKAQMPAVQKLIATMERKAIQGVVHDNAVQFFTRLYQRLWVSSVK